MITLITRLPFRDRLHPCLVKRPQIQSLIIRDRECALNWHAYLLITVIEREDLKIDTNNYIISIILFINSYVSRNYHHNAA